MTKKVTREEYMGWVTAHPEAETTVEHGGNWSQMNWWVDGRLCAFSVYPKGEATRYFLV